MTILFEDTCNILKKTERELFEDAYKHHHGGNREVGRDLLVYNVSGILPKYVQEYLEYLYRL